MFKFFKKKEQEDIIENEEEETLASIKYLVKRDSDGPIIDIELFDYDEESINGLCLLLEVLSDDKCFIDTIGIIKSSLLSEQKHDLLIQVFSRINDKIKSKLLSVNRNKIKDEPVVKPSEMMRS